MHPFKFIFLFIWQLPQNLLGFLVEAMFHRDGEGIMEKGTASEYIAGYDARFPGGVSLGRYIVLSHEDPHSLDHEFGHFRQSMMLGWLYLPVVGLFSGVHNLCHRFGLAKGDYYRYWCEAWADRLGGVKR